MSTDKQSEELFKEIIEGFDCELTDFLAQTQSPIEKLFALRFLNWHGVSFYVPYRIDRLPFEYYNPKEEFMDIEAVVDFYGHKLLLIPQFKFSKFFTVDFLLYLPKENIRLVVECDGHDFHEKTKEQAKRDKQRDRKLVMDGVLVLRYSGSEIYKPHGGIGNEIESLLVSKLQGMKK